MQIIAYVFLFISIFLFKPKIRGAVDTSSLSIFLLFFIIAFFTHVISQRKRNWFRLDIIFLLGFIIVHFQWAIMITISNIYPAYIKNGIVSSDYINYGTWLSVIGIIAWFIGYRLINYKYKRRINLSLNYKKILVFSIFLFFLFIFNAGKSYLTASAYKGVGGDPTGAGISVYIKLLLSVSTAVLIIASILNYKGNYAKGRFRLFLWFIKSDKFFIIFIIAYISFFLLVGDRTGAINVTFIFLFLFSIRVRAIYFKELILIIMIGALILTFVGEGRSQKTNENIFLAGAKKTKITTIYDLTMELSNSVRTLYSSISNVPRFHDYFYGKLWLTRFLSLVPFAQKIYLKISKDKKYELDSEQYITYLRFGVNPRSGEGTSLIADIYLNFGLIGIIFFMFLLGIFFKKLQHELEIQSNYYWIIIAGMFSSVVFYMARAPLFESSRIIFWGVLMSVIFVRKKRVEYGE